MIEATGGSSKAMLSRQSVMAFYKPLFAFIASLSSLSPDLQIRALLNPRLIHNSVKKMRHI